jgi:RNase H-like domain found in reverse transcriptase
LGRRKKRNFENIKSLFEKHLKISHYDEDKPLYLATDARHHAVGRVIFQTKKTK